MHFCVEMAARGSDGKVHLRHGPKAALLVLCRQAPAVNSTDMLKKLRGYYHLIKAAAGPQGGVRPASDQGGSG